GNPLKQVGLVHLIGKLGDDDLVTTAAILLFGERLGTHDNAASTCGIGGHDAFGAEDGTARWEVGTGDGLDEAFQRGVGIVDHHRHGVADLPQVMWRNVRGHTYGDASTAVDQHVGHARRQHRRLRHGGVVVGDHIDGVLVDIDHHLVGDRGELG